MVPKKQLQINGKDAERSHRFSQYAAKIFQWESCRTHWWVINNVKKVNSDSEDIVDLTSDILGRLIKNNENVQTAIFLIYQLPDYRVLQSENFLDGHSFRKFLCVFAGRS